jgi:hypothetical protein
MQVGGGANNASAASALEALLAGGAGNFQALLNLPDADDETMVQLAIALSLQDQVRSYLCCIYLIAARCCYSV